MIEGLDGDDSLYGRSSPDTLLGGSGDDLLFGSTGIDTFDGGNGTDTIDYSSVLSGIVLDLELGSMSFVAGGAVETFTSIEGVIGSNGADDLMGTSVANTMTGGAGDDTIDGRLW